MTLILSLSYINNNFCEMLSFLFSFFLLELGQRRHAGFSYSGRAAAYAFGNIDPTNMFVFLLCCVFFNKDWSRQTIIGYKYGHNMGRSCSNTCLSVHLLIAKLSINLAAHFVLICAKMYFSSRVFLLGPSHHFYTPKCALSTATVYKTPIGDLPIDLEGIVISFF